MKKERIYTLTIVCLCSLCLMFVSLAAFKHIDFFLNKKEALGVIKYYEIRKNKIYLTVSYYNENIQENETAEKKFPISYFQKIENIRNNIFPVLYSKWNNRIYIKGLQEPKIIILLFEGIVLLILSRGIFSMLSKIFRRQ